MCFICFKETSSHITWVTIFSFLLVLLKARLTDAESNTTRWIWKSESVPYFCWKQWLEFSLFWLYTHFLVFPDLSSGIPHTVLLHVFRTDAFSSLEGDWGAWARAMWRGIGQPQKRPRPANGGSCQWPTILGT